MINWAYIAGFFDGEGSIVKLRTGCYRITFTQSTLPVLHEIEEFLNILGVHTWITNKHSTKEGVFGGYHLAFSKSTSVRLFLENVMEYLIVKQDKAQDCLHNLTNRTCAITVGSIEAGDMQAMWDDGLSQREIANLLNRSQCAVSRHLNRRCL